MEQPQSKVPPSAPFALHPVVPALRASIATSLVWFHHHLRNETTLNMPDQQEHIEVVRCRQRPPLTPISELTGDKRGANNSSDDEMCVQTLIPP